MVGPWCGAVVDEQTRCPRDLSAMDGADAAPGRQLAALKGLLSALKNSSAPASARSDLAEWLVRHNPKHDPAMAARVKEMREAAAAAAAEQARQQAEAEAKAAALAAGEGGVRVVGNSLELTLAYEEGQLKLTVST